MKPYFLVRIYLISLINPNQLRIFGVTIQDNPYHAHKNMSLVATTANNEELSIPLQSKGVDFFLKAELQILKNWIHVRMYI